MGLRDNNPFIDQDLHNIINAYSVGVNQQDTEESAIAIFTPDAIEASNFAKNVINNVLEYKQRSGKEEKTSATFKVAGLEIKNTISTLLAAESVGDALKKSAADCVPCSDRVLALMNLNPLEDLLDLLERDILRRLQSLFALLDLLNNIDIYNDVCMLIRQLNFQCVPDLQRIALMLTLLLSKYKDNLSTSLSLPEILIGSLFTPFLSGLNTLLDQYIQMVVDPIDCMIDEFNRQAQKLDILEGIQKANAQLGKDKENPTNQKGYIPDLSQSMKDVSSVPLKNALVDLTNYLKQGKLYVESLLNFVREQLEQLLGTSDIALNEKMRNAQHKMNLLRLISLVVSIINATKSGVFNCGDLQKVESSKKLETFLNNYIAPNVAVRINLDSSKGTVFIQSPKIDEAQSTTIAEIFTNATKDLPVTSGSSIVEGKRVEQSSLILIKNCLYDVDRQDLEKVEKWISEFETGDVK